MKSIILYQSNKKRITLKDILPQEAIDNKGLI